MLNIPQPLMPISPWRLSGVVYGALLNHAPELAALGRAAHAAPYKAPPQAPVLQLRPGNSLAGDGARVAVPAGGVRVGANLGLVIGRCACRVAVADALAHIAGYLVVADLVVADLVVADLVADPVVAASVAEPGAAAQHYRPGVRQRARDGFCVLGPEVLPSAAVAQPDALAVALQIDGQTVQRSDTGQRLRGVAQLLSDVSEFMSLQPGDVLLLGASAGAPLAVAGQALRVSIAGLVGLGFELVAEAGP